MSRNVNNNMNTSPNKQSQRVFDDRKRGSTGHYSEYYDQGNYNGAQRSPTRDTAGQVEVPRPVQNQQRMMPVEQPGPTVANNDPRAANGTSRPPSYAGPPSDERMSKADPANLQRQQQRPRGYRRTTDEMDDDETDQAVAHPPPSSRPRPTQQSSRSGSNSMSNQSAPVTRERTNPLPKHLSESPGSLSPTRPDGNNIPRLNSPSVMTSVLKPLDGKVQEYNAQMHEAQALMSQLDAEMAILQDRRREAEKKFMAAKTKHDDYRRQYQGVERALRGEPDMLYQGRVSDEDDRPSTQHTARPPQSSGATSRSESWGSVNNKSPNTGNRFRLSKLFGAA